MQHVNGAEVDRSPLPTEGLGFESWLRRQSLVLYPRVTSIVKFGQEPPMKESANLFTSYMIRGVASMLKLTMNNAFLHQLKDAEKAS